MLEGGLLLGDERFVRSAELGARAVASRQREDGWLAGTYDAEWQSRDTYACVTGVAQMSLVWRRLVQERAASDLEPAAERATAYVKRVHRITGRKDPLDGALPGSAPIWGRYIRFGFPNWAVKFFADALLMEISGAVIPPKGPGRLPA